MAFASSSDGKVSEPSIQPSHPCRRFEFSEILRATDNFAESLVIGKGGFGKVYKGNIMNGSSLSVAAIKRSDSISGQGAAEFWTEVEMLSMLRHCNLVSLIGYCIHEKEMILVYDYMPNGTLNDHLHKHHTPLSWPQRLNICIGVGRGLHYLHTGTGIGTGVIHRDVKSSNILLHESWAAKLSDFGLSKVGKTDQPVSTFVKGTFGYMDPSYFQTGKLTSKSDVYAFGVVMLEVLCRKRAVISLGETQQSLATWGLDSIKEGNLKHIVDPDIMGEISAKCLKKFVRIAERCLHDTPELRPTMAEVVFSLESTLVFQEKFNSTSQPAGITIFGIRVNLFPFPSNGENSVQDDLKLSSNSKGKTITNNSDSKFNVARAYLQSQSASMKEFTFDDLEKATRKFSPDLLLGEGRSGQVFFGWVDQNMFANNSKHGDGTDVAVKRLYHYYDWTAEVNILGQFAHPNIIRLLGYCRHKDGNMLVYEYMQKKSFANFLFTDGPHISEPLSWGKRLSIMIGVARGLTYLHSAKLICQSIKPSNVLLDEDFNAKLAGFENCDGPALQDSLAMPDNYYKDNYYTGNYAYIGDVSEKTNIYSFGVTLLESMAGRRAGGYMRTKTDRRAGGYNQTKTDRRAGGYNRTETDRLVEWERMIKSDSRNVKKIIDPRLEQNYPVQGAFECSVLALRCVAKEPKDRPSSEELLQILELLYAQWMESSRHNVT